MLIASTPVVGVKWITNSTILIVNDKIPKLSTNRDAFPQVYKSKCVDFIGIKTIGKRCSISESICSSSGMFVCSSIEIYKLTSQPTASHELLILNEYLTIKTENGVTLLCLSFYDRFETITATTRRYGTIELSVI